MSPYCFDTDVLVDLLKKDPVAWELLSKLISDNDVLLLMSEVSRHELLSFNELSPALEKDIEQLVICFHEVVCVDETISRKAGELRRRSNGLSKTCPTCQKRTGGKLKGMDAFVAATAYTEEAILVSRNTKDYAKITTDDALRVVTPAQALEEFENADARRLDKGN